MPGQNATAPARALSRAVPVPKRGPHLAFELTRRENEVLALWLEGREKGEIAEMLGLRVGTVDTYLTRAREKVEAERMLELAKRPRRVVA